MNAGKRNLKKILNGLGLHVFRRLPFGTDPLHDARIVLKESNDIVFFDVGANVGKTSIAATDAFRSVKIYSFEPFQETFQKLVNNTKAIGSIKCFNIALGSKKQSISIAVEAGTEKSFMNSLVHDNLLLKKESAKEEKIEVDTLDNFCKEQGIIHIDYLKVDTEGFDLEVLTGALDMIKSGRVTMIQVEAGMNTGNTRHIHYSKFHELLLNSNYEVFGIYNQALEKFTKQAILRRADIVYILKEKSFVL